MSLGFCPKCKTLGLLSPAGCIRCGGPQSFAGALIPKPAPLQSCEEQRRALEAFARTILAGYTGAAEVGNLDGGHLQDVAVRLGILVRQDPAEAGGMCQQCLEVPCTCWFLAPWLRYVPESYA